MHWLLACNFLLSDHKKMLDTFWRQLAWGRLCNWETERLDGSTVKQINWEQRTRAAILHAGRHNTPGHAEDPQEEGSLLQISQMKWKHSLWVAHTLVSLRSFQRHLTLSWQWQCQYWMIRDGELETWLETRVAAINRLDANYEINCQLLQQTIRA